ncbi:GPW/gp25 family protein [Flavitalea flava]
MATTDPSFLGTGWGFPPTFRREWYGVEMLSGNDDIRSSIHIIMATITGERVMLPNFGCDLQPYIFDTMNPSTLELIKKIVHDALVFYEPRIIVGDLEATPSQEEGILNINVQYTVIATNTRYNYVYPFYINEATNVDR